MRMGGKVPEVGVRVQDEAHGQDLGAHLHSVDTCEDWLQLLLHRRRSRERGRSKEGA